jgi:hypothetical protein
LGLLPSCVELRDEARFTLVIWSREVDTDPNAGAIALIAINDLRRLNSDEPANAAFKHTGTSGVPQIVKTASHTGIDFRGCRDTRFWTAAH